LNLFARFVGVAQVGLQGVAKQLSALLSLAS